MTTAINGLITTKGIEKSILAQQTQGSYLYISGFGVSSTPITLSTTAKINDLNLNNVYQGLISSSIKIADTMLEVRVAIPPNSIIPPSVISETAEIKDIYLFARSKEYFIQSADSSTDIITIPTELGDILSFDTLNNNVSAIVITKKDPIAPNISNVNFGQKYYIEKISNSQIKLYTDNTYTTTIDLTANISNNTYYSIQEEFLFSVSQTSPTTELYYTPTGTTYLRLPLQIANINSSIYVFQYTQAIEISDHNTDPNAHPNIQDALELSGIFVENSNRIFNYKGQFFIKVDNGFYQIHNSVTDKKVVYYNNTFNRFENAIADGTDKQNYIGIYNEDDNTIKLSGIINTGHSFNAGEQLYLSTTIAGNIVNTVTPIRIGTALPNGNIVLKQNSGSGGGGGSTNLSDLLDVEVMPLTRDNFIIYNGTEWKSVDFQERFFYQQMMLNLPYGQATINYFDVANEDFNSIGSATFNYTNNKYSVLNTTVMITEDLVKVAGTYYDFMFTLDTNATFSLEYSTTGVGGSYTSFSSDTNINILGGFTQLHVRIAFSTSGDFFNWGVFYENIGLPSVPNSFMVKEEGTSVNNFTSKLNFIGSGVNASIDVDTSQVNIEINSSDETTEGTIEIATQTEVNAGTDDTRAVTPLKLQGKLDNVISSVANSSLILKHIDTGDYRYSYINNLKLLDFHFTLGFSGSDTSLLVSTSFDFLTTTSLITTMVAGINTNQTYMSTQGFIHGGKLYVFVCYETQSGSYYTQSLLFRNTVTILDTMSFLDLYNIIYEPTNWEEINIVGDFENGGTGFDEARSGSLEDYISVVSNGTDIYFLRQGIDNGDQMTTKQRLFDCSVSGTNLNVDNVYNVTISPNSISYPRIGGGIDFGTYLLFPLLNGSVINKTGVDVSSSNPFFDDTKTIGFKYNNNVWIREEKITDFTGRDYHRYVNLI